MDDILIRNPREYFRDPRFINLCHGNPGFKDISSGIPGSTNIFRESKNDEKYGRKSGISSDFRSDFRIFRAASFT